MVQYREYAVLRGSRLLARCAGSVPGSLDQQLGDPVVPRCYALLSDRTAHFQSGTKYDFDRRLLEPSRSRASQLGFAGSCADGHGNRQAPQELNRIVRVVTDPAA